MALPRKIKKPKYSEDDFNKFCLTHFDGKGNPFMYMIGTQIHQNAEFVGLGSDVLKEYQRKLLIKS